jgi:hypothetical protein
VACPAGNKTRGPKRGVNMGSNWVFSLNPIDQIHFCIYTAGIFHHFTVAYFYLLSDDKTCYHVPYVYAVYVSLDIRYIEPNGLLPMC